MRLSRLEKKIDDHIQEINKCNQRGGRMLSIVDLINANTLDKRMAAYCLATISKGISFLVGSKPGGSGKTTVMGALLNFLPDVDIIPVESKMTIDKGFQSRMRKCYLAHEIGHGGYYAYISGENTENFLELSNNHIIVSNLHADNIDDLLDHEGINNANLKNINLLIFVKMIINNSLNRRIDTMYENQGGSNIKLAFKKIFEWDNENDLFKMINKSKLVNENEIRKAEKNIDEMIKIGLKTIKEVRTFILERVIY
jgi:hypothetical protein